ncbi:MAG: hypothetical protein ACKOXK_02850 [Chakrabartia sp.]
MSSSAIEHLISCQNDLIRALDAGDVIALELATARVGSALDLVRADPGPVTRERERFDHALRQAEAARFRVNFLTDRVTQRLDRLTRRRGQRIVQTYDRAGKIGQKLFA